MASDDDEENLPNTNLGTSLPEDPNSTHNIALSPFFMTKSGYAIRWNENNWSHAVVLRGDSGHLWANTSKSTIGAYWSSISNVYVQPSRYDTRLYPWSLRCLVSTNNRLMNKEEVSLVSDEAATSAYDANMGATLPEGAGATHNAALTPLFFDRFGTGSNGIIQGRGAYARWYASGAIWDSFAYYLCVYPEVIWPSSKDSRRQAYSLRCLVSTNNG